MSKRKIIGIVLIIVAILCFVAAACLPGDSSAETIVGVCIIPFVWIALRGDKNKKGDK